MGELRTKLIAGHEARAVRRRCINEVQAQLAADSFTKDAKVGEAARGCIQVAFRCGGGMPEKARSRRWRPEEGSRSSMAE